MQKDTVADASSKFTFTKLRPFHQADPIGNCSTGFQMVIYCSSPKTECDKLGAATEYVASENLTVMSTSKNSFYTSVFLGDIKLILPSSSRAKCRPRLGRPRV